MAEAGTRFESYVREAMTEAGLSTWAELTRQSGVQETTWHAWFRGENRPRRTSLRLAEPVLGRTPEQLLAIWDGERPQRMRKTNDPVVVAIESLGDRLERILGGQEARLRALEAELGSLRARPEGEGSPERSTPSRDSGMTADMGSPRRLREVVDGPRSHGSDGLLRSVVLGCLVAFGLAACGNGYAGPPVYWQTYADANLKATIDDAECPELIDLGGKAYMADSADPVNDYIAYVAQQAGCYPEPS